MSYVRTYAEGFTIGQRDAVIMAFPINVGRNTGEFWRTHRLLYTAVLRAERAKAACPGLKDLPIDPALLGYADGFDQARLELWELLQ